MRVLRAAGNQRTFVGGVVAASGEPSAVDAFRAAHEIFQRDQGEAHDGLTRAYEVIDEGLSVEHLLIGFHLFARKLSYLSAKSSRLPREEVVERSAIRTAYGAAEAVAAGKTIAWRSADGQISTDRNIAGQAAFGFLAVMDGDDKQVPGELAADFLNEIQSHPNTGLGTVIIGMLTALDALFEVGLVAEAVQVAQDRGAVSEPLTDKQRSFLIAFIENARPVYLKAVEAFVTQTIADIEGGSLPHD